MSTETFPCACCGGACGDCKDDTCPYCVCKYKVTFPADAYYFETLAPENGSTLVAGDYDLIRVCGTPCTWAMNWCDLVSVHAIGMSADNLPGYNGPVFSGGAHKISIQLEGATLVWAVYTLSGTPCDGVLTATLDSNFTDPDYTVSFPATLTLTPVGASDKSCTRCFNTTCSFTSDCEECTEPEMMMAMVADAAPAKVKAVAPPCRYRSEEARQDHKNIRSQGLNSNRTWYTCEHPDRIALGMQQIVTPCQTCGIEKNRQCGTKCSGYLPAEEPID